MKKAIAVFGDSHGNTIPMDEAGQFVIYKYGEEGWQVRNKIDFVMDRSQGIGSVRRQLQDLGEELRCCSNIVAAKINGLPYTVLDPMGFELWEIMGRPEDFLDEVMMEAETEVKGTRDSVLTPKKLDEEGHFYLDLKGALKEMKGSKSSKEILTPFLEKGSFYELKVLCDHIPPWFDKKLGGYGLAYEVNDRGQGEMTVIIRRMVCSE